MDIGVLRATQRGWVVSKQLMPSCVRTFRSCLRALVLLCTVAACGVPASEASAASTPAILRTDAFLATRYDANTALVFFNNTVMPAGLGTPAGVWPQGAPQWAGNQAHLRLVRSGEETQWKHYWPGNEEYAPKVGGMYVIALGASSVRGVLSSVGYLPLCDTTWLVGLITVDAVDRSRYVSDMAEGMVAYLAVAGAPRSAKPAAQDTAAVGTTVGKDKVLNAFPLDALPMFDQGEAGEHADILLTEVRSTDGVTYALKRRTPGGLIDAGVTFENYCK
jgi:hypothetical protein